jgi:subtilisin-like proprotein convertase family protein
MRSPRRRWLLAVAVCGLIAAPAAEAGETTVKRINRCVDTKLAIPDGGLGDFVNTAIRTSHLPRGAQVLDVDARVRLTHSAVGELDVLVTSPVGIMVPLTLGNGGLGDDLGAGATDCRGTLATFDDRAPTPIQAIGVAGSPFAGSYRPEQPLRASKLTPGDGDWRFYFDDLAAGNAGTVEAIGLRLKYRCKVERKRC